MRNEKIVIAMDTMGTSGIWGAGDLLVFLWAVVTHGFILLLNIYTIYHIYIYIMQFSVLLHDYYSKKVRIDM